MGLINLYILRNTEITDLQKKQLFISNIVLIACGILKLLLETILMIMNDSIDLVVTFNLIMVGIILTSLAVRALDE